GVQQAVEHVVVEDDQHAVLRGADVELVAVAAQLEGGAEGLQGVLVGVLRGAAVADDVDALAALRDALVAALRLGGRFCPDGRKGVATKNTRRHEKEKKPDAPAMDQWPRGTRSLAGAEGLLLVHCAHSIVHSINESLSCT